MRKGSERKAVIKRTTRIPSPMRILIGTPPLEFFVV
jgi:hypothetical protein